MLRVFEAQLLADECDLNYRPEGPPHFITSSLQSVHGSEVNVLIRSPRIIHSLSFCIMAANTARICAKKACFRLPLGDAPPRLTVGLRPAGVLPLGDAPARVPLGLRSAGVLPAGDAENRKVDPPGDGCLVGSWSITSRTRCQCRRRSRSFPIAAMYSHASLIVRSVPPSFVGSGEVSFLERYSGRNMAINSKRRRRTLNHGFETRIPPRDAVFKRAPLGWPPQLGRAPLRLGRHGAEPSGQDFHRSVNVRRAERARVRRRPRRVRAAACHRRRPALGLPHRRWS